MTRMSLRTTTAGSFMAPGTGKRLTRAIFSEDYEAVRQEYRLIRRQGVQVIVPYDPELFHQIKLQAQRDGPDAGAHQAGGPHHSIHL